MACVTDRTHDPALRSWVASANEPDSDFPIQNLPFAAFLVGDVPHTGVAIGDRILDATAALGIESVQSVMAMTRSDRAALRRDISGYLANQRPDAESHLRPQAGAQFLLPCTIGDYTDFYASIHHATNVGSMFRPDNPLLPNYKWLPVGYHGRASSIVVSGTPIRRPRGQTTETAWDRPLMDRAAASITNWKSARSSGQATRSASRFRIAEADDHIVRRVPAERLVGARYPNLGVSAARSVSRQKLRHVHLAMGDHGRSSGAVPPHA